jgi:hypothetical protein
MIGDCWESNSADMRRPAGSDSFAGSATHSDEAVPTAMFHVQSKAVRNLRDEDFCCKEVIEGPRGYVSSHRQCQARKRSCRRDEFSLKTPKIM